MEHRLQLHVEQGSQHGDSSVDEPVDEHAQKLARCQSVKQHKLG